MKVICAGMSKSGTKSVHLALEELGFEVYDFLENFRFFQMEFTKFMEDGWSPDDFRRMYKDIEAVVASPAYYFWEELMKAFPEAKIILMIRDSDDIWYKSIRKQRLSLNGPHCYYYPFLSSTWRQLQTYIRDSCYVPFGQIKYRLFNFKLEDPPELPYKLTYRKHIAHVIHNCPKDLLLIYNCKSGWKPLCEFLGKPEPKKTFAWLNKNSEYANTMWDSPSLKQSRKEMLRNSCLILTGFLAIGIYFAKYK